MSLNVWIILYILVICLVSIRIFLRKDLSPPARLAWVMVLFVVPYVGAVIYLLFGEASLGKKEHNKRQEITEKIFKKTKQWTGEARTAEGFPMPHNLTARYAGSINGFYPVGKNQATLMKDSRSGIRQMVKDIDAAKHHVHVLIFIWLDDESGNEVAEALLRAADRGVICRVMIDAMGSYPFKRSKLWKRMKKSGIRTQVVLSFTNIFKVALFSRVDLRNHRKIVVIDNQITYCGSQNICDPEFRIKKKYAPWVDVMIRITGPIVAQNQLLFATDWLYYHPDDDLDSFLTPQPKSQGGGFLAQAVGDGPTIQRGSTSQLFTTLIASARESLVITTPYFVPNPEIVATLVAAGRRGVKISLIVPARNDNWEVRAASRSHYHTLLEAGVRIYEYVPGLLHSKILTIDDQVTMLGSSNLDMRSFDLNYENNVLIYDPTFTATINRRQKQYIADSNTIILKQVDQWSRPKRIWYNIIATIGPVL